MRPSNSASILEVQGYMHGGSCTHTVMLCKGLSESGFRVMLAGPLPENGYVKNHLSEIGVPYNPVALRGRSDFRSVARLIKMVNREHIDIVHTHCQNADFLGGIAARLAGARLLVTTIHGLIPEAEDMRKLAYLVSLRLLPDHLIAISESVRQRGISLGLDPKRITTILNASETGIAGRVRASAEVRSSIGVGGDEFLLACVGVLDPSKGTETAIRALPFVVARHPKTRLLIIGDGKLRPTLEALCMDLRIAGRVSFLGHRGDVPDLMNASDIVVNPSRMEGFGRVNTEAMALGKPVVCSDIPAFREIVIDGVTGFLVPLDDPLSFASAISRLLDSPDERQRLGSAGRGRVRDHFNANKFVTETRDLFDHLLARRR